MGSSAKTQGPGPLTSGSGFERMYAANEVGLVRFFARRVYDPQLALDLAAETFAQAFVARRRFHGSDDDARAWLFTIAHRQLGRYYRRGRAELRAIERLGLERPDPSADEIARIERLAELGEARAALAAGLARLSDDQRAALRLRIVEERPYREVADQLGVSEPTARARVSRGLRALAETAELGSLKEEMAT